MRRIVRNKGEVPQRTLLVREDTFDLQFLY